MGIPADDWLALGLWLLDTEGRWLLPLLTVTVVEGRLCVEVEGLELQSEALAVLPGGKLFLCVEVGCDGCSVDVRLLRGGAWSCLDCPILWLCLYLPSR